jgi:Rhodopsin-like GPCR transmembrane domain
VVGANEQFILLMQTIKCTIVKFLVFENKKSLSRSPSPMTLGLVLFPCLLLAKFQSGLISLGGVGSDNRWKYISKFSYLIGTGKWQVRFKFQRSSAGPSPTITADVYLDNEWDEVEAIPACERVAKRRTSGTVEVPTNGEWSKWITGNLAQSFRPHVWYVAAHDCKANLPTVTRLKFEFRATQFDGSEFSAEMTGVWTVLLIQILVYSVFSVFFVKGILKIRKSSGDIHPILWTLGAGFLLHIGYLTFEFIHFTVYAEDGEGIKALNVLGQMLEIVSQVVISSLLILIGSGYTLLHSSLGNLDIVIPIIFIIGVVHLLLVGFGKIKDDASYKFSENEGVIGYLLILMRGGLYAWFLWAVRETGKETASSLQMTAFLKKFRLAGSFYFLAYPLAMLISGILFPPYVRHKWNLLLLLGMTMGAYTWLSTIFLGRGQYFKVSTLSSSALPGGLKVGVDKEE